MENKKNILYLFEFYLKKNKNILFTILASILVCLPYILNNQYLMTIVIKIGIYSIFALGLNILTGYTGLVSLGHAGFVAIGAYTSSICAVNYGYGFVLSTIIGMVIAGVIGVLLGLPSLRVTGTYLSIITLGFGEIIKMIAMNWNSVTNGTLGIKNIPKPSILGVSLTISNHGIYYMTMMIVIFVSVFSIVLLKSKIGRALQAIRSDEMAALMMGIRITSYKILAFVISACICALGGSLYATLIGYIDPNTFNFDVSTMILSIVILGGMGTVRGMFIGSILLIAFPEISRFLMEYRFVLYGIILVIMMRFRPQGILGWKSTLPYYLSKKVKTEIEKLDSDHFSLDQRIER